MSLEKMRNSIKYPEIVWSDINNCWVQSGVVLAQVCVSEAIRVDPLYENGRQPNPTRILKAMQNIDSQLIDELKKVIAEFEGENKRPSKRIEELKLVGNSRIEILEKRLDAILAYFDEEWEKNS